MKMILPMLAVAAALLVSGCITNDMMSGTNRFVCESLNGGLWLEEYGECCPKGCPETPIEYPQTVQEQALAERCEVCWLS